MAMMGYNFTERVRGVLAEARREAGALDHEYIGTEHLLLGLATDPDGVAVTVLRNLGVDPSEVADHVREIVRRGTPSHSTAENLPYTSRAKKVLELAMREASDLNHTYVGTEHLLLGLLEEQKGIAAQALQSAGATLDDVRKETLAILGTEVRPEPAPPRSAKEPRVGEKPKSVGLILRYTNGARVTKEFPSVADAVSFLEAQ